MRSLLLATCAWGLALAACDDTDATGPTSPTGQLAIGVAPLSLSGVTDARYAITVTNGPDGTGDTVWTQTLTADVFGDGAGSVSYVGPCDASTGTNSVTLVLEALFDVSGEIAGATYQNPTPITKNAVCVANEDTEVAFDIAIVRQADQGFFDVAVSFEDIFCSAKLDCVDDATGDDLNLLHDPASGERDMTAVLGLACTAAPTGTTFMYADDPVISCTGLANNITVDATGLGTLDLGQPPSANTDGYLFAASVFRGAEELAGKGFWNLSFGLDESLFATAGNCTLSGRATASKEAFAQTGLGFEVPAGIVYPVITWDVQLSNSTARVCTQHPVNGGNGVSTDYVGFEGGVNLFTWSPTPIALANRFEPATGQVLRGVSCTPTCANGGACVATDTCDCAGTGYAGSTCETPVCTLPCQNGGTCVAPETCDCSGTGYAGADCTDLASALRVCSGTKSGVDAGGNTYTYVAGDCDGGELPTNTERGLYAKGKPDVVSEDWTVGDPTFETPHVTWFATAAGTTADLSTVYVDEAQLAPGDVIVCRRGDTVQSGAGAVQVSYTFSASDCGGTLPDASYWPVLTRMSVCGADQDWTAYTPGQTGYPGMDYWVVDSCSGRDLGVTYLKTTSTLMTNAIFCDYHSGAANAGDGDVVYTYTAANCGGTLPGPNHVGVLWKASQCGNDKNFYVLNDGDPGGPGVGWNVSFACQGIFVGTLFLERH